MRWCRLLSCPAAIQFYKDVRAHPFYSSFFFVLRSFYTLRFFDAGTAQETTPLGSIPLVGALLRVNRVDVKKGLRSDLAWSVASPGTHARVRCLCAIFLTRVVSCVCVCVSCPETGEPESTFVAKSAKQKRKWVEAIRQVSEAAEEWNGDRAAAAQCLAVEIADIDRQMAELAQLKARKAHHHRLLSDEADGDQHPANASASADGEGEGEEDMSSSSTTTTTGSSSLDPFGFVTMTSQDIRLALAAGSSPNHSCACACVCGGACVCAVVRVRVRWCVCVCGVVKMRGCRATADEEGGRGAEEQREHRARGDSAAKSERGGGRGGGGGRGERGVAAVHGYERAGPRARAHPLPAPGGPAGPPTSLATAAAQGLLTPKRPALILPGLIKHRRSMSITTH